MQNELLYFTFMRAIYQAKGQKHAQINRRVAHGCTFGVNSVPQVIQFCIVGLGFYSIALFKLKQNDIPDAVG